MGEDVVYAADSPVPAISVYPGEGDGGSDRVKLLWADNAIESIWLQVTVLATGTGIVPMTSSTSATRSANRANRHPTPWSKQNQ